MYAVSIGSRAKRFFEEADAPLQRRIDRCFDQLKIDPRHHNQIKALKGAYSGYLRFRIGDYRVVYRVRESTQQVFVADIAHRREVYE